jgi:glucokinase
VLPAVIGIDVGGTSIKGVLVDAGYSAVAEVRQATPCAMDADALTDAVAGVAGALIGRASNVGTSVAGVGIASAGVVDERAQIVRWASNLAWDDTPLARLIEERTGLPAVLLNDARAAARAEGLLGAARGVDDFVLITLGTGIGGALVSGGVPRLGAHGLAGEIGHLRVVPDGLQCGCGGRGCLETIASAHAVSARYTRLCGAVTPIGAETVVQRAGDGDGGAATVWSEAIEALAAALAATVAVVDCELIVIGGGMAAAGPLLLDPLSAALEAALRLAPPPRLVVAQLGDLAGALGAAVAIQCRISRERAGDGIGQPTG